MSRLLFSLFPTMKVMALALTCLLALSVTAHTNTAFVPVSAPSATATPKDETVFVNLASDGALREVQVVNTFRSATGGLVDYGDYAEVTNLSNTRPLALGAGRVSIALEEQIETTFRYQGRLADAVLPWLFSFTYQLDGKLVPAALLLGQSGRLTISVAVRPNPMAIRHFSDHYTVQVVVPLLVDRSSEVRAEGATAMLVGNRLNLAFTVMPGESLTQSITAEVHDFALPPIEISALRMARPQGEWLDELDAGFTGLTGGMESIIHGTTTLRDGLSALHAGVGEISASLTPMLTHAGQFQDGLAQSAVGIAALSAGLTEIYGGQSALNTGERILTGNLPALKSGYANLAAGSAAVLTESALVSQLATTLAASPDPFVKQLAEATLAQLAAIESLQQGLAQANAGLEDYARARAHLSSQNEALLQALESAASSSRTLAAGLGHVAQAGTDLIGGLSALPQGINELHISTAPLPNHVGALVAGQRSIQRGISDTRTGLGQLLGEGPQTPVISFASPERAQATSVQFVMVTPPVEAAPRTRVPEEHATPTTLWQRVVDLARRIVASF